MNNQLVAMNGGFATQVGLRGYNQVTILVRKGDKFYFEGYHNGALSNFPTSDDIYTSWWYK